MNQSCSNNARRRGRSLLQKNAVRVIRLPRESGGTFVCMLPPVYATCCMCVVDLCDWAGLTYAIIYYGARNPQQYHRLWGGVAGGRVGNGYPTVIGEHPIRKGPGLCRVSRSRVHAKADIVVDLRPSLPQPLLPACTHSNHCSTTGIKTVAVRGGAGRQGQRDGAGS